VGLGLTTTIFLAASNASLERDASGAGVTLTGDELAVGGAAVSVLFVGGRLFRTRRTVAGSVNPAGVEASAQ